MHQTYRYVTINQTDVYHLLLHVRGQMTKKTPCGLQVAAERDRRYDEPPQDMRLCKKCDALTDRRLP